MTKIGTLVEVDKTLTQKIDAYADAGFESISFTVWQFPSVPDFANVIANACEHARTRHLFVSSLSVYGNPLSGDETGQGILAIWTLLVDLAAHHRVPVVSGFAGRVVGKSVADSIESWKKLFSPLAERALNTGTKLAFENCRLGDTWKTGKWNIAINPDAWDLMFRAVPAPNIGLEWEPCHQIEMLVDPAAQLRTWAGKVFHVHGKDSSSDRAALAQKGFFSPEKWHKSVLPGLGDSNWDELCVILDKQGYEGTIDLENPADSAESFEIRLVAEAESLRHLKQSRSTTVD